MYTYVQRPVCKKENTATYVHTGRFSNAYSCIRTAKARVHGCVGTEKQCRRRVHGEATECSCSWGGNGMRRVHGEATECVVFIGRQRNACRSSGANRLGRNNQWKRGLAYRRTEETAVCPTGHGQNRILFIGRGLAYRKTEEIDLYCTAYRRNRVLLIWRKRTCVGAL